MININNSFSPNGAQHQPVSPIIPLSEYDRKNGACGENPLICTGAFNCGTPQVSGNVDIYYDNYGYNGFRQDEREYLMKRQLMYDKMCMDMQRDSNFAALKMQEMEYKAKLSQEAEERRAKRDEELLIKKEELLQKRELITCEIILDSEGRLCKEILDANGKIVGVKAVCRAKNISSVIFYGKNGNKTKAMLLIFSDEKFLFGLIEDKINWKEMEQGFQKSGYPIQSHRDYKKSLSEQILSYVIKNAKEYTIPLHHGWNDVCMDFWRFVDNGNSWEGKRRQYGLH